MRPDDAPAAADLCVQLGYPAEAADIERRLGALSASGNQAAFVAAEGGTVVGWIHVALRVSIDSDPWAEIAGLVVDTAHRSRGIGRQLVETAERWAREQGCRLVRVRSRVAREAAHRFYQREGYRVVKTQHVFEKQL